MEKSEFACNQGHGGEGGSVSGVGDVSVSSDSVDTTTGCRGDLPCLIHIYAPL